MSSQLIPGSRHFIRVFLSPVPVDVILGVLACSHVVTSLSMPDLHPFGGAFRNRNRTRPVLVLASLYSPRRIWAIPVSFRDSWFLISVLPDVTSRIPFGLVLSRCVGGGFVPGRYYPGRTHLVSMDSVMHGLGFPPFLELESDSDSPVFVLASLDSPRRIWAIPISFRDSGFPSSVVAYVP